MSHYNPNLSKTSRVAQNLYFLTPKGRIMILPENIVYLEGSINYTIFYTTEQQFTTAFHLKFFGKVLENNPDFLRISKSYIVNIRFLEKLEGQHTITNAYLKDGTSLQVSRRKAIELRKAILDKPITIN